MSNPALGGKSEEASPGGAAVARDALWFDGPAGRLEARAEGPPDGAPVVLLHPHPQAQGTMGSRLVYDLAKGLAEEGRRTYRFNFRGVGRSEGTYGEGLGETEDALAVYDAVHARHGAAPVVIGHSFGAAVGIRLAARRSPPLLVVIGSPPRVSTSRLAPIEDAPAVHGRVHLVVGSEDEFVTPEGAAALAAAFGTPAGLTVLDGAGHFLEPSDNPRVLTVVRGLLGDG